MVTGKEVITSSKFQNNFWQTQLYFSFLLSIILLARTSVEVPGTLQKLLEFWTPLHVYKKCPCPQDKQASVASLVVSPLSIGLKQAVCFTVSLSLSVLTSVVSSSLCSAPHQPLVLSLVITHCIVL